MSGSVIALPATTRGRLAVWATDTAAQKIAPVGGGILSFCNCQLRLPKSQPFSLLISDKLAKTGVEALARS
jgi:hypothetical protein